MSDRCIAGQTMADRVSSSLKSSASVRHVCHGLSNSHCVTPPEKFLTAGEYQDRRFARRSTASLAEALRAKATRTSFDVLDRVSAPSNLTPALRV